MPVAALIKGRKETGQHLEIHREALCRMVRSRIDRRIRHRLDADDVVQEVMLEAHKRLREYQDGEPPIPLEKWLRQIARDRVIDAYRRHRQSDKRSVDNEHSTLGLDLCDMGQIAGESTMAREIQGRLERALEALKEHELEIVLMRHFEQLSSQEVASATGLTVAAVAMRYLRAIRRMRAILQQ